MNRDASPLFTTTSALITPATPPIPCNDCDGEARAARRTNMNTPQPISPATRGGSLPLLAGLLVSLALLCSGCLAPRSYVDPQFRRASYQSLRNIESPHRVTVGVEFQV